METPRIYVDFNEMLEADLVLLSKSDHKLNSNGDDVYLYEGLYVYIYSDDFDEQGKIDNLIAEGLVEKNIKKGYGESAKWCCRLNKDMVIHESDKMKKS